MHITVPNKMKQNKYFCYLIHQFSLELMKEMSRIISGKGLETDTPQLEKGSPVGDTDVGLIPLQDRRACLFWLMVSEVLIHSWLALLL